MRSPNFFIVGAPKSGTTAMSTYLRRHPEVFIPTYDKEPHFFAGDLHCFTRARHLMGWKLEPGTYFPLFKKAGSAPRVGEASVFYLHSIEAAEAILRFDPQARLIAMLRRPDEMIYSLHREYINTGIEPESCFRLAWERDEVRSAGRAQKHEGTDLFTNYAEVAAYATQLGRYLDRFPPDQIKVIRFERFASQTAEVYAETLRFLGVSDRFRPTTFERINASERPRSERLARWLRDKPAALTCFSERWVPPGVRGYLDDAAYRLNMRKSSRPPLHESLRGRILARYSDEVTSLSRLIQEDLSSWLAPGPFQAP